ncbi:MAG: SMP-30/gluconolactonase/LRE family protein [Leptospiraceae bacterium]|nr:SMP-30/gluconolactonase/LRE family protein [Leptospiraceae bacterium]
MRVLLLIILFLFGCNFKKNFSIRFLFSTQQSIPITKGALILGNPNRPTNEFGSIATFTIHLDKSPSSIVNLCLISSNITSGGNLIQSSDLIDDVTCAGGKLVQFNSNNWNTDKTVKVSGSRGTVGVSGDTDYQVLISVSSEDVAFQNLESRTISLKNIDIDRTDLFFVRTKLTGFVSGNLSLRLNSSITLVLTENGEDTFSETLSAGSYFSVSITSQANNTTCAFVNSPFGTLNSHYQIQIECVSGSLYNGTIFATSNPPTLSQSFQGISTISGSFPPTVLNGYVDGNASDARFNEPIALTTDGQRLFIADIFNNKVRVVSLSNGSVSTLADVINPHGIATDGTNVYVTSFSLHIIYQVNINTGNVSVICGTSGVTGDIDGACASARLNGPTYLTTDGNNLFITDRSNNKIKQIVIATGTISTLASGFNSPNGIATDGTNVYVADSSSHQIKVIEISTGIVTTIAGTGSAGNLDSASGTSAILNEPYGITIDGTFIYVLEGSGKRFKKILKTSPYSVTTFIDQSNGYVDGAIGTAQFCNTPTPCDTSITTDGLSLYFSDRFNHSIRKIVY